MTISDLERSDLIASVRCTDRDLVVSFTDERTVTAPLWWYPRLLQATPEQRARFEIGRFGIHWPEIDEDIELAGLLLGAKAPGAIPPVDARRRLAEPQAKHSAPCRPSR